MFDLSLIQISNIAIMSAGIIWGIELIPQIVKTFRCKDSSGLSLSFFMMCFLAYLLYIFGNALSENWIVVYSHIPSYVGNMLMVCLIVKYNKKKKKFIQSKFTYYKNGKVRVHKEKS